MGRATSKPAPIENGDKTMEPQERFRQQLVETHLNLVRKIASEINRKTGNRCPIEDLVHIGTIGLMEAARRYDPTRGYQFSTFAYYRIRGAILDGMRSLTEDAAAGRMILEEERTHSYLQEFAFNLEIQTNVSLEKVVKRLADGLDGIAMCHVLSQQPHLTLDALPAPEHETPSAQLEQHETYQRLHAAIVRLDPVLRETIYELYYNEKSMESFAQQKNRSKSWASRTHAKAIHALQELMRSP